MPLYAQNKIKIFLAGAPTDSVENISPSVNSRTRKSPAENACHWATTIKQALMPVTPTSSAPNTSKAIKQYRGLNLVSSDLMSQLKVPNQGN